MMNATGKWTVIALAGALTIGTATLLPATAQGRRMQKFGRPEARRLPPTASWGEIDKTPKFSTNSRPGYYVWRQGDEVFVVSNDPNRTRASRYDGEITVRGGTLDDVSGYKDERNDRYRQVGKNRATFRFDTNNGLDGVKFHVNGGKEIVMRLHGGNADSIYLGQDKIVSYRDPLVIAK